MSDQRPRNFSEGRRVLLASLIVAGAAVAAYANTFRVPFVFDDVGSIVDNPTIRRLWPLSGPLSPPAEWGFTVSGRPVLNLSFALNYANGGLGVGGYHALNLLIHVLAGLTLFGLVRRTLLRPALANRFSAVGWSLPLVIAAVWTLHPLQTESVTYVVQRAESLMGLFFLLTLYGFVRAVDSPQPRGWMVVSWCACFLGAGTKEVAALTPIVVMLYDRTFVSGGFSAAWRRHRWFHLALASTWLPLAWLVAGTGGNRGGTVGFDVGASWPAYWLTQFEAVSRYLSLAVWPHPLVFEYGKVVPASGVAALVWTVPIFVLVATTAFALWRRPVAGFFGACFFGLLAPTSIVPGAAQMIVEHRMYLPLAAVLALGFGWIAPRIGPRALIYVGAAIALAAGAATFSRNEVYRSAISLWEDTIAKRPDNARAQNNLGLACYQAGRIDDAVRHYETSLRLDPTSAQAHYNLGLALMRSGRAPEAVAELREAVKIIPRFFNAHLNLGIVLTALGRAEEALPPLADAIALDPNMAEAHFHRGIALAQLGRWSEAIEYYAAAVKIDPGHAEAHSNWGVALFRLNAVPAAIGHFEEALRLKPDLPAVHFNLGLAATAAGRPSDAIRHYGEAVRLDPRYGEAELNLGIALGQAGRLPEAVAHLERAVELHPDSFAAHSNLAIALADAPGRAGDSLAHHETALRLRPDDPQANYNAGYALLTAGRWAEARLRFENALKLRPGFSAAAEMLRQMQARQPPP